MRADRMSQRHDQGSINRVTFDGDSVQRPLHPWTRSVHSLLGYLTSHGFPGVPAPRSIDEDRRIEVVSFIDGSVALRPWPEVLKRESGLTQLGDFLRRYHEVVEDFVPCEDAVWHVPDLTWQRGDVIRHGDLGPWNTVWRNGTLSGVIDWDFAEPGSRLADIAQLAWHVVPLRGADFWREVGFEKEPDLGQRLGAICAAYGASASHVVDALLGVQDEDLRRISELGARGILPWSAFRERGDASQIAKEQSWLVSSHRSLLG